MNQVQCTFPLRVTVDMKDVNHPRVSLLLISYNQDKYIRDAVRSVLNQNRLDFELVVCDDGSTDQTVEILEDELSRWDGPIPVRKNYSSENRGLISNFNQGMGMCYGEYIIVMAGDDISLPARVSACVEAFDEDPDCMLVLASWDCISENGQRFDRRLLADRCYAYSSHGVSRTVSAGVPVCGAAAAYRRELFDCFGPISSASGGGEDNYYWFRALLLGHIRTLSEPLVLWRRHSGCLSNANLPDDANVPGDEAYKSNAVKKYHRFLRNHEKLYIQWWTDLETASKKGVVSGKLHKRLKRLCFLQSELSRLKRYSLARVPFSLWCKSCFRLLRYCTSYWVLRRIFIRHFGLWLSGRKRSTYFVKRVY